MIYYYSLARDDDDDDGDDDASRSARVCFVFALGTRAG